MKTMQKTKNTILKSALVVSVLFTGIGLFLFSASASAVIGVPPGANPTAPSSPASGTPTVTVTTTSQPSYYCGSGNDKVYTSIDIGCDHKISNPIADMVFAIIRLLSDGVGIVVIASVIVGGIQYSVSHGDPQASAAAVGRIRSSMTALFIFIFAYAILNYVIPAGFFQ
jgi:hypothetical protein